MAPKEDVIGDTIQFVLNVCERSMRMVFMYTMIRCGIKYLGWQFMSKYNDDIKPVICTEEYSDYELIRTYKFLKENPSEGKDRMWWLCLHTMIASMIVNRNIEIPQGLYDN